MISLLLSCALAAPASLPETLRARHDALVDAGTWDDAALAQAKAMPEGGIFPFVFPLLAYANLVADGTVTREALRPRVDAMAADALASTQRHLGRTVATLDGLHDQGTWLGELHLALSVARWLGSTAHETERARLDALFHEALAASAGHPLPSYPGLVWPFDTMPPVLALRVSDAVDGTHRHDAVVRAHLAWLMSAEAQRDGLPASRVDATRGTVSEGPRGCDLSWRLPLLAQIDPGTARTFAATYLDRFWTATPLYEGLREWAPGVDRPADVDSGPVVFGVGTAATGMGVAVTRVAGDAGKEAALRRQLDAVVAALPALRSTFDAAGAFPDDPRLVTGLAVADAALLWSTTHTVWGVALPAPPTP